MGTYKNKSQKGEKQERNHEGEKKYSHLCVQQLQFRGHLVRTYLFIFNLSQRKKKKILFYFILFLIKNLGGLGLIFKRSGGPWTHSLRPNKKCSIKLYAKASLWWLKNVKINFVV
jgi:hypothetical protein